MGHFDTINYKAKLNGPTKNGYYNLCSQNNLKYYCPLSVCALCSTACPLLTILKTDDEKYCVELHCHHVLYYIEDFPEKLKLTEKNNEQKSI